MHPLLPLSLLPLALAHFEVSHPTPLGADDSSQGTAPCGGYAPDLSSASTLEDVSVGGQAFVVSSSHPQSDWLFRATLDPDAEDGWVQVFPIFQQSGIGTFCQPDVVFPDDFAGRAGVVSVVGSAIDGMLYSCIAANFVSGSGTPPDSCANGSAVDLAFTTNEALSGLLGDVDDDDEDDDGAAASLLPSVGAVLLAVLAGLGFLL